MAFSLSDLLTPQSETQVESSILARLQGAAFSVTDWLVGATERTRVKAFAFGVSDFVSSLVPVIAGGGFVDTAKGAWLQLKAHEDYATDVNLSSNTIGNMTLTCASTAGPYTITDGQLKVTFPSGNRYINVGGGVLGSSGTLTLAWRSESLNNSAAGLNYVDPSSGVPVLITPLAGVTVDNPAPPFSAVSLAGVGTGTVTPSGTPLGQYQIAIRVDVAGQSGAASWSYSVNGAAYVSAGAVGSALIPTTGITVTLANGGTTPSFLAGEVYTFQTPGTWITTQGTDQESDPALSSRCKNKWPSLSSLYVSSPTLGYYDLLARSASNQVTQTRVQTDGTINNKVYIVVAGQGGVLPAGVVSTVQSYVSARVTLTDYPVVLSPSTRTVTLTGTITVDRAKVAAAQASAQASVSTYINSTVGINGTVKLSKLIAILEDTDGILDVSGLQINGAAANLVLPVTGGAYELPSWTQTLSTALTWQNG